MYILKTKDIKRNKRKTTLVVVGALGLLIAMYIAAAVALHNSTVKSEKMEQQLNSTVREIQLDIDNGDYDDALIKANTLYYDRSESRTKADEWDEKREALIELIQEKKKEAEK